MPRGAPPTPTWWLLVELDLPGLTGNRLRAIGRLSWTDVRALGDRWERAFGAGTTTCTERPGPVPKRVRVGTEPVVAPVATTRPEPAVAPRYHTGAVPQSRFRRARDMAGLSIAQAAKLFPWTSGDQSLRRIEKGERPANESEQRRLAHIYGVSVSWLRGEDVEPSKAMQVRVDPLPTVQDLVAISPVVATPRPRTIRDKPASGPTARRRATGPSRLTDRARAAMARTRAARAAINASIAGIGVSHV